MTRSHWMIGLSIVLAMATTALAQFDGTPQLADVAAPSDPSESAATGLPDNVVPTEAQPAPQRQAPSWDYKSNDAATGRIYAALDSSTQLQFIETPLGDVLHFLQDLHGVRVTTDQTALDNVGVGADSPITANVKDVSLGSALRQMLAPLGLDYIVADESLVVTSKAAAAERLETRVYDTSPLSSLPPDDLADVVRETVAPASWREAGGEGRISEIPGGLVIRTSQRTHQQVIDLLRQLFAHEQKLQQSGVGR